MDTSRRCDACGVQAYWTTWIDLTELCWCSHHFRAYEVKLREKASLVVDHTWELTEERHGDV